MHTLQGPLHFYSCKCTPFCSCKSTLCRHRFTFAVANAHSAGTALLLRLQIHTLQGPVYFAVANAHFAGTALLSQLQIHTLQGQLYFAAANTHFTGQLYFSAANAHFAGQLYFAAAKRGREFCSCKINFWPTNKTASHFCSDRYLQLYKIWLWLWHHRSLFQQKNL